MVSADLSPFADAVRGASVVVAVGVGVTGLFLGVAAQQFASSLLQDRVQLGGVKQSALLTSGGLTASMLLYVVATKVGEGALGALFAIASGTAAIATIVSLQSQSNVGSGLADAAMGRQVPSPHPSPLPSARTHRRSANYGSRVSVYGR